MAYNSKIYKKLLAHTTFLSLISGVALSSAANTQTSLNSISPLSNSSSWSNGPFASGDNILFGGNHQIVLDQAGYFVNYVDTNGYSGGKISVQSQTAMGSVSNITNTGNSLGLTTVEFVNDVELFMVGNDYNYGNYYAITSITPSSSLGSGKGTVNFGVTVTGSQDIPFDLGTPDLRLDKVGVLGTSSTNAPTVTDYQSATVVLKSGHKIYANEFQLSPVTVWGNDFTNSGASNTLELEDGTILDAKVTTRRQSPSLVGTTPPWYDWLIAEAGALVVGGGATIVQDVGTYNDPVAYVFFNGTSPDQKVLLSGNLYAFSSILVSQPTIVLQNDLIMNSDVLSTGSTYDLQDNTLTFQSPFPYIREDDTGTRFYDNITLLYYRQRH